MVLTFSTLLTVEVVEAVLSLNFTHSPVWGWLKLFRKLEDCNSRYAWVTSYRHRICKTLCTSFRIDGEDMIDCTMRRYSQLHNHIFQDSHSIHAGIFHCKLACKTFSHRVQLPHSQDNKNSHYGSSLHSETFVSYITRILQRQYWDICNETAWVFVNTFSITFSGYLGMNNFLNFWLKLTASDFFKTPKIFAYLNRLCRCQIDDFCITKTINM